MTEPSPPSVRAVLATLVAVLTLSLVVPVALVVALAAPASAEAGSRAYDEGDAPARIDLTRLRVRNGEDRFRMRADVSDLRQRGTFSFVYWRGGPAAPPARGLIVTIRRVDGETVTQLLVCGRQECLPAPCDPVRGWWRPKRDELEVSAPHRCYPRREGADPPRRGRFFVASRGGGRLDDAEGLLRLVRG